MEASNSVAYTIGYTAGPNWSNVACVCVRMWGKKTRPKTRPLGDKTKPIGTLLMCSALLSSPPFPSPPLSSPLLSSPFLPSPVLSSPLLCCRFSTLPYSSLLYSSLPTSTLFYSSLLCSSLLFFTLLFSTLTTSHIIAVRWIQVWSPLPHLYKAFLLAPLQGFKLFCV